MVANQQEQISNHFLEQAKQNAFSTGAEIEDEVEPIPSELNTINSSGGFLVVSTDKLSVQYTNVNLHGHDVGVIQANCPAPVKRLFYYFELKVKNGGSKGQISIGFTNHSFKMRRQLGKNRVVVGTVYKDVKSQLFPTIAVHSQNEGAELTNGFSALWHDVALRL